MQRYIKTGFGIIIPLKDTEFTVRANILRKDKEKNSYDITFELRKGGYGWWDTLDEEHFTMHSENINSDVYELVVTKYKNGYFKYFMDIYDFDIACIKQGDEYFEKRHELFYSRDPKYTRSKKNNGGDE